VTEVAPPATAAPPAPRVRSVRHLGSAPLAGGGAWRLLGQDGGQSIALGEETLFVFSDTLLQPAGGGRPSALANCAARSRERTLRGALGALRFYEDGAGLPREVLPASPEERCAHLRFWPAHGLLVDGVVYLFYLGIEFVNPRSDWGFRNLGAGLARLDPATGEAERLRRGGDWCLWRAHGDDFHFGVQTLREGEWVYVFLSARQGYHSHAGVARAPAARLAEPEAYAYYAGGGAWSPDPARTASLGPAGNDYSVSWNDHLGGFLMTYVDPYAKLLYHRTAPAPWGPWGAPLKVGALPHRPGSELIYLGFEHPRFAERGGRTVHVTYGQPHFVQNSLVAVSFA
jgi:hypothetical protein